MLPRHNADKPSIEGPRRGQRPCTARVRRVGRGRLHVLACEHCQPLCPRALSRRQQRALASRATVLAHFPAADSPGTRRVAELFCALCKRARTSEASAAHSTAAARWCRAAPLGLSAGNCSSVNPLRVQVVSSCAAAVGRARTGLRLPNAARHALARCQPLTGVHKRQCRLVRSKSGLLSMSGLATKSFVRMAPGTL